MLELLVSILAVALLVLIAFPTLPASLIKRKDEYVDCTYWGMYPDANQAESPAKKTDIMVPKPSQHKTLSVTGSETYNRGRAIRP